MKGSIDLGVRADGEPARLDVQKLITSRLLVQANSGGGKSWLIRRLLEQSHGLVQHLVLDIEGEFHTLRERFDYVLAAKSGGDTLADPRSAGLLARRLLELGTSAILDLYELKAHDRIRFVRLFLESLVDAPRALWHPTLIVVDEAHIFCPEKGSGEAESAAAVIDLMTRGRKRGFCGVLATQRLSKLHKDAAAEANVKLIGRAALDVDMKRAAAELGLTTDAQKAQLRTLAAGEMFAFGPGLSDQVIAIQVGSVQTTHQRPGQQSTPIPPTREKVKKILEQLADLPKEAEAQAKSVEDLKRRIVELERQVAAKPAPAAPPPPAPPIEIPVVTADQLERLTKLEKALREVAADLVMEIEDLNVELGNVARSRQAPPPVGVSKAVGKPMGHVHTKLARVRASKNAPPRAVSEGTVSPVGQRVLNALAELEALGVEQPERVQVAFLSGYTNLNSKGFSNALGLLRSADFIDYPQQNRVQLTPIGAGLAAPPTSIASAEELQARVMSLIGGACARILEPLIAAHPDVVGREDLAAAAGYTNLNSKGFSNALGRLRSLGFIDYPQKGAVAAAPVLFLGRR